jgi:hypothetical protein
MEQKRSESVGILIQTIHVSTSTMGHSTITQASQVFNVAVNLNEQEQVALSSKAGKLMEVRSEDILDTFGSKFDDDDGEDDYRAEKKVRRAHIGGFAARRAYTEIFHRKVSYS